MGRRGERLRGDDLCLGPAAVAVAMLAAACLLPALARGDGGAQQSTGAGPGERSEQGGVRGLQPPDFKGLAPLQPKAPVVSQAAARSYFNYCNICLDHTMCRYHDLGQACRVAAGGGPVSRPPGPEEQEEVAAAHNTMRWVLATGAEWRGAPGPQPAAANMRLMWYDDELASVAQRWADQCQFRHDTCRSVERFPVGQNIYLERSSRPLKRPDWNNVAQKWFDEVAKHSGRQTLNPYSFSAVTGHFTQLSWADTFLVGCGVSEFAEYYGGRRWYTRLYVCNYGPTGNVIGDRMYWAGEACSHCAANSHCYYGLCV